MKESTGSFILSTLSFTPSKKLALATKFTAVISYIKREGINKED